MLVLCIVYTIMLCMSHCWILVRDIWFSQTSSQHLETAYSKSWRTLGQNASAQNSFETSRAVSFRYREWIQWWRLGDQAQTGWLGTRLGQVGSLMGFWWIHFWSSISSMWLFSAPMLQFQFSYWIGIEDFYIYLFIFIFVYIYTFIYFYFSHQQLHYFGLFRYPGCRFRFVTASLMIYRKRVTLVHALSPDVGLRLKFGWPAAIWHLSW